MDAGKSLPSGNRRPRGPASSGLAGAALARLHEGRGLGRHRGHRGGHGEDRLRGLPRQVTSQGERGRRRRCGRHGSRHRRRRHGDRTRHGCRQRGGYAQLSEDQGVLQWFYQCCYIVKLSLQVPGPTRKEGTHVWQYGIILQSRSH